MLQKGHMNEEEVAVRGELTWDTRLAPVDRFSRGVIPVNRAQIRYCQMLLFLVLIITS